MFRRSDASVMGTPSMRARGPPILSLPAVVGGTERRRRSIDVRGRVLRPQASPDRPRLGQREIVPGQTRGRGRRAGSGVWREVDGIGARGIQTRHTVLPGLFWDGEQGKPTDWPSDLARETVEIWARCRAAPG